MKLFEISAMVTYHVVVAADSEEKAMAHVSSWENAWASCADLIGVSDVEIYDVRDVDDHVNLQDLAHEIVP